MKILIIGNTKLKIYNNNFWEFTFSDEDNDNVTLTIQNKNFVTKIDIIIDLIFKYNADRNIFCLNKNTNNYIYIKTNSELSMFIFNALSK